MPKKYFILITIFLVVGCNTSKISTSNKNSIENDSLFKYVNKKTPSNQHFYLTESYEYNKTSLYGNLLNQHYIQLKNKNLDEIQIGIIDIKKKYETGISDKIAFGENFSLQLSWLNQEKNSFENEITNTLDYIIYNVKNDKINHTILFGTKFNKNIYIQIDNPKTEYDFEVEKIKKLFNSINL